MTPVARFTLYAVFWEVWSDDQKGFEVLAIDRKFEIWDCPARLEIPSAERATNSSFVGRRQVLTG